MPSPLIPFLSRSAKLIMNKTLVILVVGLSPALVGQHTPHLKRLSERGGLRPPLVGQLVVVGLVDRSLTVTNDDETSHARRLYQPPAARGDQGRFRARPANTD